MCLTNLYWSSTTLKSQSNRLLVEWAASTPIKITFFLHQQEYICTSHCNGERMASYGSLQRRRRLSFPSAVRKDPTSRSKLVNRTNHIESIDVSKSYFSKATIIGIKFGLHSKRRTSRSSWLETTAFNSNILFSKCSSFIHLITRLNIISIRMYQSWLNLNIINSIFFSKWRMKSKDTKTIQNNDQNYWNILQLLENDIDNTDAIPQYRSKTLKNPSRT